MFDALQALFQKIDLYGLPADLALQLRRASFFPAALPFAGEGSAGALAQLPPPTAQQVGIDLKGPANLGCRGAVIEPFHRRQFELLRESPSRQTHHSSSIQWILSLNSLSHFWGQVQVTVDPAGGTPVPLGNPAAGAVLSDAEFFDGLYWYISAGTDDLRTISFNAGGTIASDDLVIDLLVPGETLIFGDIGIRDGILHGSARRDPAGDVVFFTVDLNPASGVYLAYIEHQSGAAGDPLPLGPVMQLGFGDDGTLFGVTGALTGFNDLYYVSLVPATLGERGLVLEDFAGGPFTDMAQFNPVCDCPRLGEPGCLVDNGQGVAGVCEESDD